MSYFLEISLSIGRKAALMFFCLAFLNNNYSYLVFQNSHSVFVLNQYLTCNQAFFLGGGGGGDKKGRRTPDRRLTSIKCYSNLMEGASISHTYLT